MRLLHLTSLEFREFFDNEIPPYAILSHRWSKGEITYKDMRKKRNLSGAGFAKLQGFCTFARSWSKRTYDSVHKGGAETGWKETTVEWGWIDACCIDKSSSAELTEAINSMFKWYRNSDFCCVYLADVFSMSENHAAHEFERSEWFTRGWTLQELLAPWNVLFCDAQWKLLGHKCTHLTLDCSVHNAAVSLNKEITRATNIHTRYLRDAEAYAQASIACRMSWAAHRKTTRVEDVAYCLLGLFDVHLPPLYGEGENAFRRLQEELLRRSNDQSIFAWFNVDRYLAKFNILKWEILATPILASHPADFSTSGNVGSLHRAPDTPYSLTNNGLELRTRLKQYRATEINAKFCTLELNCAGGQRVHPLHNSIQRTALATQIALLDVGFVVGPRAGVIAEEFMRVHLHPIAKFKLEECPAEGEEVVHVKYVKSEGVPYSFNTTETGLMKRAINYSASARPNSPIVIPAVQPIFLDAGGRNHEEGPISRSIAARYLETRRVNADERLNDSIGLVGTGLHTSANERGAFTRRPEKYTNTK